MQESTLCITDASQPDKPDRTAALSNLGLGGRLMAIDAFDISIIPLGLGFLRVIVNSRHHGWADKLAGTSVAYAWPARPDETFMRGPSRRR